MRICAYCRNVTRCHESQRCMRDDQPAPASCSPAITADENFIRQVEREIQAVEYYTPTMPLNYATYHDYIRELIKLARKNAEAERGPC